MRRITLFIVSTIASVVLLFSYWTSRGPSSQTVAAGGSSRPGIVSGPDTGATAGAVPGATTGSAAGPADVTVNGTVARTRWGPVQVQAIIANGRITDVRVLQSPQGNSRDEEINSYALPELHDQVLAAQSANIDGVSGATVTSDGYIQSLQAALDAAHFR